MSPSQPPLSRQSSAVFNSLLLATATATASVTAASPLGPASSPGLQLRHQEAAFACEEDPCHGPRGPVLHNPAPDKQIEELGLILINLRNKRSFFETCDVLTFVIFVILSEC